MSICDAFEIHDVKRRYLSMVQSFAKNLLQLLGKFHNHTSQKATVFLDPLLDLLIVSSLRSSHPNIMNPSKAVMSPRIILQALPSTVREEGSHRASPCGVHSETTSEATSFVGVGVGGDDSVCESHESGSRVGCELEIETVVPDDLQIHEQKRQLIKLSMKVQQIEQGTNAKFAQVQSEQDNMRQELSDVKVRVNSLEKKSYSRKFTDMMIMTEFSASVSNNSRSCPSSYLCRGPNGKITD